MFSLRSIDDDQTIDHSDFLNLTEIRRSLSDHLDMCRFVTDEDEQNWLDLVRQREDAGGDQEDFDLASSYQILMSTDPEDLESVISDVSEGSVNPEPEEIFGSTIARNASRFGIFSPVPIIQESRPASPFPAHIGQCNCSICARLNTNHPSGVANRIYSPLTTETSGGESADEDTEMYGGIDTQIIVERNSLYSSDEDV